MADKSLSTIAQELWQGFGRNPRNTETFEALANVNPIMAAYRGAKTLSNVDLNALKQAYLNEAYGRNDPNVNRAAGRELLNLGSGILDVVPAMPIAKAGMKAAAPHLAEGAVNLAEKYGLSPVMNIVPPEGNLNFRPAIEAGKIKGPEKQRAGDMLRQLKNKPGVTKEALDEIREKIVRATGSTNKVMTKQEFEKFVEPSKYEKVDLKRASDSDVEHYMDEAENMIYQGDVLHRMGIPDKYHEITDALASGDLEFKDLSPTARKDLSKIFNISQDMSDADIANHIDDELRYEHHNLMYEIATDLQAERAADDAGTPYPYEGVQRLVHSQPEGSYFELGVTHPEQAGKEYRHYRSEQAPKGLIGHIRGSHLVDPTAIQGGVVTEPNSYIVEEIQSDAQKAAEQTGHLSQVHGTLAKAAIQDAIERGADRIYFPTSYPIGVSRGRAPSDYASIYDQAIMKEALNPISEKYGVQLEPQMSRHLFPDAIPKERPAYSIEEVPYFHKLELTPELKERINLEGLPTPGYAAGGLIETHEGWDEESIDKMSDQLLQGEYGLRVSGEPKGKGALGEVRLPDGQTVMTEYSINPQGKGEMPSIVEGMHPADLNYLREYAHKALKGEDPGEFPEGVEAVAKRSAQRRKAEGKPAFYAEGGSVKDPFADLGIMDKAKLLGKAIKYRVQYNKQAEEHGKYPDVLAAALKEKYREQVGNSRVNRSPLDAAINYGGGYDFGVRSDIPANVARDMAKAYQYTDYFFSPFTGPKSDAIGDYYENMAGVEAGIKERGRRASEAEIQRRAAAYGRKVSEMLPQNEEENYAEGGLVYNDDEISKLADQLIGV